MSYLLNPENINNEKEIPDKGAFVEFISTLISEKLSIHFSEMSKKFVYEQLVNPIWLKSAIMSGSRSTSFRKELINRGLIDAFEIDYEKGKYDELYPQLKNYTFENEYMKATKAKYL